jgi:hypothetical protein
VKKNEKKISEKFISHEKKVPVREGLIKINLQYLLEIDEQSTGIMIFMNH